MNDSVKTRPPSADRKAKETAGETAGLFAMGVQRHQRGDLAGAWQHYEAALARDPAHAESLHHLGIIATQTGRHELAAELIGRAIGLNDRVPEFHYNIGIALGSLGQFDKAVEHNRKAVELKPDYAAAFMNLGKALLAQGNATEAIGAYRRAVALVPNALPALLGLANALADAGKLDDAVAQYRNILALNPNDADTHNNLGTLFAAQGRLDDAISSYQQALRLNPKLATAEFNFANALRDSGRSGEAIDHYRNAVRLNPGFAAAYRNLVWTARAADQVALSLDALSKARALDNTPATDDLLHTAFADPRAIPHAVRHRELLIDLLALPRDDLNQVMPSAISALESNPVFAKCLARAPSGAAAFEIGDLEALAEDKLLFAVLGQDRICSVLIERFLTAMRAALLEMALKVSSGDIAGSPALKLQCALARYCFQVEYVFAQSDRETEQVRVLQSGTTALPSALPSMLLAIASYGPLHALPDAERLAQASWPPEVETVVEQQIREPHAVARVAATIPRLTPIEDEVSQRVARQYEESPFPRWTRLPVMPKDTVALSTYLRGRFPAVPIHLTDQGGCDYLVAGCGTGRHAAQVVRLYRGARVTAIDLSRASLGYAKYKTDSLGITGISFGQADIMALRSPGHSLGRSFDVIDSFGVLHHMASPADGWRVLLGLLRPNGCMRIALYSELGRRHIAAARTFISGRGYGQSIDDIRRCRQELLALPEDAPERQPALYPEFFGLSDCRDLLFHVQEHRMTFPWIAQFLEHHGLELIGLDVDAAAQQNYRARFPDDTPMTDLNNWHVFEQENPDLFWSMYHFWVQRKLGAGTETAAQP